MNEIIFNGKNSYKDLDVILTYFKPHPPEPKIIKQDIPYMNGSYDFSEIYGEAYYSDRLIGCKLQYKVRDKRLLYVKYSEIIEWLLGSGKSKLIYTGEPYIYYMAKVEKAPNWDEFLRYGSFEFEFTAYPFRYSEHIEGSIPWDNFNFETDCIQENKFNVSVSKSVELINLGSKKIAPTVICTSPFEIIKNGITYKFNSGATKDWRFILDKGSNNLFLKGNGNIEIVFRKEVF